MKSMKRLALTLAGLPLACTLVGAEPVITVSAPIQLTTDPASQLDPALSGDIVVFTDLRNGNEDVYYFDLSTGMETRLTSTSTNQRLHDVSGSRIVLTDASAPGTRIVLHDVVSGNTTHLAAVPPDQNPRIDGDIVTFERGFAGSVDVVVLDLATMQETRLGAGANDLNPVPSGRRVVYERHALASDPGEIVLFDLDTEIETVLGDPVQDNRRPDIDRNLVVWDFVTTAGDREIAVHDIATGVTEFLTMAGNQRGAHVSGRVVTFDDDSSGTSDVWAYDIVSGERALVASGSAAQFLNDVSGSRIAYTTNEWGNFDIALVEFDLGPVLAIAPQSGLEFGSVGVGAAQTQIVTLSHLVNGDLELQGFSFDASGSPGFSVGLTVPRTVALGESLDVAVSFAPVAAGAASSWLRIATSAGTIDVALGGTGVNVAPPPQQQIADILAFFDAAVVAATLRGSGNGNSAGGRRQALRNMLEATGDLLQQGRIGDACQQLADAHDRTDGLPKPPEFVDGPAAAELALRIVNLRSALRCVP